MPEQLLTILQICLLLLLYLFLARVLRAVWVEIGGTTGRATRRSRKRAQSPPTVATTTPLPAVKLVFVEPSSRRGQSIDLLPVTTIGRAAGSTVAIDDQYLSQNHARIRWSDASWWIEDLGSTNGTSVNGVRLTGIVALTVGDRVQLGDVVLEVR